MARRSRIVLAVRLVFQNSEFVAGVTRPYRQRCECQKQPWTKIILRRDGSTMSGLPGRSLRCRRKRYPIRCTIDRTINSGLVSRDPIRDMLNDRCAEECTSVIADCSLLLQHELHGNHGTVAQDFNRDLVSRSMTFDFGKEFIRL